MVLPEADAKLGHIVSILSASALFAAYNLAVMAPRLHYEDVRERIDFAERMLLQGGRGLRLQEPADTPV